LQHDPPSGRIVVRVWYGNVDDAVDGFTMVRPGGPNMRWHYGLRPLRKTILALVLLIAVSLVAYSRKEPGSPSSADWDNLVDEFFADYFRFQPSLGTYAGFHQYDSELEDYSRQGVQDEVAFANRYVERFDKFRLKLLSSEQEQDRQFVISQLKARLLELQAVRGWEKNPDVYSSGITQSAFGIMSRKFAPQEQRLRSLIEREKRMPAIFVAARANLKNPPRIFTEVAIQQLPGLVASSSTTCQRLSAKSKTRNCWGSFTRATLP
jgi:uncharacterized protein (DUF885 family)